MVFLNSLFRILSSESTADSYSYDIVLNPENEIYKAHFPGEPITPGVCILQTGFELLSLSVGYSLELTFVKNVKFLSILRPDNRPVRVNINKVVRDTDQIKAQIEIETADTPIAKMSIVCKIAQQD